jgi:5-hydroxyisourate hydrolase
MSGITTHVLDVARGVPAAGISVTLARVDAGGITTPLGTQRTDADGRARALHPGPLDAGRYRLVFETAAYHAGHGLESLFPAVIVDVEVREPAGDLHVPLLLSPFGYTTYRGS